MWVLTESTGRNSSGAMSELDRAVSVPVSRSGRHSASGTRRWAGVTMMISDAASASSVGDVRSAGCRRR